MTRWDCVQVLLGLIGVARGYTTFTTKCSPPTQETNFISSPDTRGTLDILWSCLFTIFACTWTIQHLNVPEQRGNRDPGIWGDIKWSMKGSWKTSKWMFITVLAPEILIGKACAEYTAARTNKKGMKEFAEQDGVEWGLSHAFFATMGGFLANKHPALKASEDGPQDPDEVNQRTLGGVEQEEPELPVTVTGGTLLDMRQNGYISRLPDITSAELNDRSKGSIFIKAIAIGQVLWNAIQIVVRASRGLAITQLELATAAFSICAIIIYLLLLKKPQGVLVPLRPINLSPEYSTSQLCKNNVENSDRYSSVLGIGVMDEQVSSWRFMPNDIVPDDGIQMFTLGSIFGSVLFGTVHTSGWNLSFHNPVESLLWRISSVCVTGSLPLTAVMMLVIINSETEIVGFISLGVYFISLFIYVLARSFLLVECFRTLLFLPPDAYISTWASNIPHVA